MSKTDGKTGTVTTLVLPVAGLGKRLRPLTLSLPKALVSLNGKPLIEYAIEETRGTDITHVVVVASPNQREQLEQYFSQKQSAFPHLKFSLKIQESPAGNGHAVLQAADILRGLPFAVRFCDDVLFTEPSPLRALTDMYTVYWESIVLLEKVPHEQVSSYGVVEAGEAAKIPGLGGHVYEIRGVVEKPALHEAPSDFTIVGGYVLHPRILEYLETLQESLPDLHDDALLLTDAFRMNLISGHKMFGWEFDGKRFDCGTLEGLKKSEKFLKKHPSGA